MDYVERFRALLTDLGAEPVGIGAFAALRFRLVPRETTDIDFLVRSLAGVAAAAEALGLDYREVADEGGDPYLAFIRGRDANGNSVVVDLLKIETDYQLEAHDRAVDGWLTVEDVIVHKLIAWRPRDRDDIESILATRPALDRNYIERWAREWQVADRWELAQRMWAAP
ncbi:MAG: hypothetical protein AB7V43_00745 [Acidimicrobiia bacterium]